MYTENDKVRRAEWLLVLRTLPDLEREQGIALLQVFLDKHYSEWTVHMKKDICETVYDLFHRATNNGNVGKGRFLKNPDHGVVQTYQYTQYWARIDTVMGQ